MCLPKPLKGRNILVRRFRLHLYWHLNLFPVHAIDKVFEKTYRNDLCHVHLLLANFSMSVAIRQEGFLHETSRCRHVVFAKQWKTCNSTFQEKHGWVKVWLADENKSWNAWDVSSRDIKHICFSISIPKKL